MTKQAETGEAADPPVKKPNGRYLAWNLEPDREEWGTAHVVMWKTICGRYKLYRIVSKYHSTVRPDVYFSCSHKVNKDWRVVESEKEGPGYPRKYTCLSQAVKACESHAGSLSNSEQLILSAGGLAHIHSDSLFGHPVADVLRWMGKNGITLPGAVKVLRTLGVECLPATVKAQLKAGLQGPRTDLPVLSASEQDTIWNAVEGP